MRNFKSFSATLLSFALVMAAMPSICHAANSQVEIVGMVDCGQDTCSVVPVKKVPGQPLLSFLVKSKAGSKILKQGQACPSRPLQMTVTVDKDDNIVDVLKVTCVK